MCVETSVEDEVVSDSRLRSMGSLCGSESLGGGCCLRESRECLSKEVRLKRNGADF